MVDLGFSDDAHKVQRVVIVRGPGAHALCLWIGRAPVSVSLAKALSEPTPLSAAHRAQASEIFGERWETELAYDTPYRGAASEVHVIRESLYPDDPLLVVRWKCMQHIPGLRSRAHIADGPESLYLWAREEITDDRLREIALFPSAKFVEAHARMILEDPHDRIAAPDVPPVTAVDAFAWLRDQVETHGLEHLQLPRELEYRDTKDRPVYMYANPFDERVSFTDYHGMSFTNYQGEFKPVYQRVGHAYTLLGAAPMFFVATAKDVFDYRAALNKQESQDRVFNGLVRPYFPEASRTHAVGDRELRAEKDATIERANAVVSGVLDHPSSAILESIAESRCRVQRLAIGIDWMHSRALSNNIKVVFNQLETTDRIPFFEYRDSNENLFKIRKQNMAISDPHEIQWHDLSKWVTPMSKRIAETGAPEQTQTNSSKPVSTKLIARIYFATIEGTQQFFTLIIDEQGKAQLKYKFKLNHDVALAQILASFADVNALFDRIETLWAMPGVFPRLSGSVLTLDCPSSMRVLEWETSMSVTFRHPVCPLSRAKTWLKSMYPFVEAPSTQKDGKMALKYKRVQNYHSVKAMDAFVHKHRTILSPEQLKDALRNQFLLDGAEAAAIVESAEFMPTPDEPVSKDKYAMYRKIQKEVAVQMELHNDNKFRIILKGGLKDALTANRVFKLIVMAWLCNTMEVEGGYQKEWQSLLDAGDEGAFIAPAPPAADADAAGSDVVSDYGDLLDDVDFGDWDAPVAVAADDDDAADDAFAEFADAPDEDDADSEADADADADADAEESSAKAPAKAAEPEENRYRKEILKRLQAADRDLFAHKWTSSCGAENRRQPIVLTRAQKERIDREFPGSYGGPDNYKQTGTTEDRARRNYYVCPKVWCPQSEVTLTREQLAGLGGKCPPPYSETPIFLDGDYWRIKGREAEHYPNLHNYGHPRGVLQPCCGKRETKAGAEDDALNGRYILRPDIVPVENRRFGALPESLGVYFQSAACSGHLSDNRTCYVRMGIPQGPDAFFECMVQLLDNPAIGSVDVLKRTIAERMSVFEFIKLNQGNLVKVFFDQDQTLQANYARFKAYLLDKAQDTYAHIFHLRPVRAWLEAHDAFEFRGYDESSVALLREYMIYNAYTNYLAYVASGFVPKDAEAFFDLFNRLYPWLNSGGYNLLLFSQEGSAGVVSVACPRYVASKYVLDLTRPFVMVIKQTTDTGSVVYEPIIQVSFYKGALRTKTSFSYFENPFIRQIAAYFENNCMSPTLNDAWRIARKVMTSLEVRGHRCKELVLDMSFKLRGVVLTTGLFVPLPAPSIVPDSSRHNHVRYLDALSQLTPTLPLDQIMELFDSMGKDLAEPFYTDYDIITDSAGKRTIALQFGELVVPIALGAKYAHVARPADGTVFIQSPFPMFPDDESLLSYPGLLGRVCRRLLSSREAVRRLRIIKHPENPFPWSVREEQLREWVAAWMPDAEASPHIDRLVEDLSTKDVHQLMNTSMNSMRFLDSELLLNRRDVQMGRLADLYARLRNPFRHVENSIEDYVEYAVLQTLTYEDVVPPKFEEEMLPLKPERWNRMLKGDFGILVPKGGAGASESANVLDIFFYASKLLRRGFTRAQMASHLLANKREAFKESALETVEALQGNASFRRMTRRTPADVIAQKGWAHVRDLVLSDGYAYGENEIIELAYFLDVNVILLGRQHPQKFRTGVRVIDTHNQHTYLLLHIDHSSLEQDVIRCIGRRSDRQFVLDLSQMPAPFVSYVQSGPADVDEEH